MWNNDTFWIIQVIFQKVLNSLSKSFFVWLKIRPSVTQLMRCKYTGIAGRHFLIKQTNRQTDKHTNKHYIFFFLMRAYGWFCNTAILSFLGQSDSHLSTLMCVLFFFPLMLSLPAAWCMYIHPASFHHSFLSQQPNNEALHETVKPAPATMSLHYSWRRLGCLICMKLCADSYNYKLPFVTVKQISVTTI